MSKVNKSKVYGPCGRLIYWSDTFDRLFEQPYIKRPQGP